MPSTCEMCGSGMPWGRGLRKTCSNACRQRKYTRGKKAAEQSRLFTLTFDEKAMTDQIDVILELYGARAYILEQFAVIPRADWSRCLDAILNMLAEMHEKVLSTCPSFGG